MNLIHQINGFLAKSIGLLNAGPGDLTGSVWRGIRHWGDRGFSRKSSSAFLVGVAVAVGACGLLAVLINIRDLLAELLDQRRRLEEPRAKSED